MARIVVGDRLGTLGSADSLLPTTSLRKASAGRFSFAHLSSGAPIDEEKTDSFCFVHPGLEPRRFATGSSVVARIVVACRLGTLGSADSLLPTTSLRKPSAGRFSFAHLSSGAPTKEEETDSFYFVHPGLEPRRFATGSSVAKDMVANLRFDTLSSFGFLSSATSLRKASAGRFSFAHLSSGAPSVEVCKSFLTDLFFCKIQMIDKTLYNMLKL